MQVHGFVDLCLCYYGNQGHFDISYRITIINCFLFRLSAFVMKSFSQAKRYIYIDDAELQKTATWILRQQREDGTFNEPGRVIHKAMQVHVYAVICYIGKLFTIPVNFMHVINRYLTQVLYCAGQSLIRIGFDSLHIDCTA